MQYFVSIENNSYHLWQIELLIESFKKLELENDLLIAIAENDNPVILNYKNNILNHTNKFVHPNYGMVLNKYRSLVWALENGSLSLPLTILHPDMVLTQRIFVQDNFDIIIQKDEDCIPGMKEIYKDYAYEVLKNRRQDRFHWVPWGGTMVFSQDVNICIFVDALNELQRLYDKHGNSPYLEKFMWISLFNKRFVADNYYPYKIKFDNLEIDLLTHMLMRNVIHYKHGLAPDLNKHNYHFNEFFSIEKEPFEDFKRLNVTTATDYICKLIDTYQSRTLALNPK